MIIELGLNDKLFVSGAVSDSYCLCIFDNRFSDKVLRMGNLIYNQEIREVDYRNWSETFTKEGCCSSTCCSKEHARGWKEMQDRDVIDFGYC